MLLGEIAGPVASKSWDDLYEGEKMMVRPVRWIAERARASFKPEVRTRLGTPNPIMLLERSLRDQIIRATYDQYVFKDEFSSRLRTTEEEFSTLDDYNIQTFVNYVAGVLAAVEKGYEGDELTFDAAIEWLEEHEDLIPEMKQNINSKGFQRIFASTLSPIAIGALLSIATASSTEADAMPPLPAVVNKAANTDDPCAIEVAARVERALRLMRLDDWKRVCAAARSAKARTGLSTSMTFQRKAE